MIYDFQKDEEYQAAGRLFIAFYKEKKKKIKEERAFLLRCIKSKTPIYKGVILDKVGRKIRIRSMLIAQPAKEIISRSYNKLVYKRMTNWNNPLKVVK